MSKTFSDRLTDMAQEFESENLKMLEFTTVTGVMVRMEKCTAQEALINTVCDELKSHIEESLHDKKGITHIGIRSVNVVFRSGEDEENDNEIIEPDIWESNA